MPALPDQADILLENEQLRARVCRLEGRHYDASSANTPFGTAEWEKLNPQLGSPVKGATPAVKSSQSLTELCRSAAKPTPQASAPLHPAKVLTLTEQCLAARR